MSRYDDLRCNIETLDLILFSGKGRTSNLIKRATNSEWSHVGLAVWVESIARKEEDRLFIVESTTLNDQPDISGEYRKGVQMMPLSQRVDSYDGHIGWSPLKPEANPTQKRLAVDWLFSKHAAKTEYDTAQAVMSGIDPSKWNWFLRLLSTPFHRFAYAKEDLEKLFCSELVTKALKEANILPDEVNASEQTPEDVLNFHCYRGHVEILK